MRDASAVLTPYRERIARLGSGEDVGALRREILSELWRESVPPTDPLRKALEGRDFFTLSGFDAFLRSLARTSSNDTRGRASTSYLALLTTQQGASAGAVTPSDAVLKRQPARNDGDAQLQVDTLLRQLIAQIQADTNEALLATLAQRALRAARQLSCDIVNELGGSGRSLNAIERRYTEAFTRSLQRIGIDFSGGYFATAKPGKAARDRLDIELRASPELTMAFETEHHQPIETASRDELTGWFMKRAPNPAELEGLAFQGGPTSLADRVRESILRALVCNAVPRRDTGGDMVAHIGTFGWNWLPRDARDEPDPAAVELLRDAYHRLGIELYLLRQKTFEPGPPGSAPRQALAKGIRADAELSAAFQRDQKTPAAEATADALFDWFQTSTPRLDQVLALATRALG